MTAPTDSPAAANLAAQLTATHSQLMRAVSEVGSHHAYERPDTDEWSAAEVLAHVPEFQRYWLSQVKLVRSRPGADFGRRKEDPERVSWIAQRRSLPLEELVADLDRTTRETIDTVAALTPADLECTGMHFRHGEVTVAQIVQTYLVEHLEEHLQQLSEAVAAVEGSTQNQIEGRKVPNHG